MKTLVHPKYTVLDKVSSLATGLSSPARLKILYVLAQAPRSVDVIAQITGESVANTSQHLQRLLHEGFVLMRKEKLSRIYSLRDELVAFIIEDLFDLAEKISPETSSTDSSVTLLSIVEDIQNQKAVLLDVREELETEQTPIEGATAIPLDSLKDSIKSLKKNKTYYVFCRGRACGLASEAVTILRSSGLKAFRLKESPLSIRHKMNLDVA